MRPDKIDAIERAKELWAKSPLILDTETTGLDSTAEICEIAIVDHQGGVIFNRRVRPENPIPAEAVAIHGITNKDVSGAPSLQEALELDLMRMFRNWPVAIYNAAYDLRMLRQSGAGDLADLVEPNTTCVMDLYSVYHGQWNDWHQSYTWQSLTKAAQQLEISWDTIKPHSALGDALMTMAILRRMANTPVLEIGRE